ncbi:MAG: cupin domain-containing protein [Deltaproteobacteria bacterium]|nr:cupin domain-containing protein [Deltaproteobacteria bacterium]
MLVRNLADREVKETAYVAHKGALATMVLDPRDLRHIGFLAHAIVEPGRTIEAHRDPVEEIYFVYRGRGRMRVGEQERPVAQGDAIHIPVGEVHTLTNDSGETLEILVIASP